MTPWRAKPSTRASVSTAFWMQPPDRAISGVGRTGRDQSIKAAARVPWNRLAPWTGVQIPESVEQRQQVEHAVRDGPAVGKCLWLGHQRLQHHGRFALEAGCGSDTQQPAGGIEPAPAGGCLRGIEAAFQHLDQQGGIAAGGEPAVDFIGPAKAEQGRCRHAPGLPRRHVSARLRQGREMAEALVAGAVHQQEFSPRLVPSSPKPKPSRARPTVGPVRPCSASTAATWAW